MGEIYMRLIGNILWIIFGGLFTALGWFLLGLILCITIIFIPFGKQCFKYAKLSLAPFGKTIDLNFGKHPIANVIWVIFVGWGMFLTYIGSGIVLCITIIGIPFGLQSFKMATLGLFPFGAKVR
jgi:uncharacterized membrane protein YccF (DUF307 family)